MRGSPRTWAWAGGWSETSKEEDFCSKLVTITKQGQVLGYKRQLSLDKLGGGSLQRVNYIETVHLSVSNVLKESLFVHLIIFQVPQFEADAT